MNEETTTKSPEENRKKRLFKRIGKNSFWIWIAYQSIKGSLTMAFIWAPLIYWYFHSQ